MQVNITTDDIINGDPHDSESCAMALAINKSPLIRDKEYASVDGDGGIYAQWHCRSGRLYEAHLSYSPEDEVKITGFLFWYDNLYNHNVNSKELKDREFSIELERH